MTTRQPIQRKVARRHLIYYLRVFDQDSGDLLGNLVDISEHGIMLVSDRELPEDKIFHLRMLLPETVDGSRDVEFSAKSRWCGNDTNPDFFDTGFELIEPSQEFLAALDRLLEGYMFNH
ncbi:Hypothetical protein HDN1F_34800 [gamma proteobacterium HdN1]|nr:Hypothetical protein HDN1F_34800 [gamma proteobacterium HdN1]